MINLRRNDRPAEPNVGLKPALYEPPGRPARAVPATAPDASPPASAREIAPPAGSAPQADTPSQTAATQQVAGSKLSIGINIKLKGVEISDCDIMVIEGQVEATVHAHVMEISKPGTLKGTALIDVAEIHGDFSGELTARTRLVIHGTGRVSGTIRYGKLVIAEGGELNGDVRQLDATDALTQQARDAAPGLPIAIALAKPEERAPH